VVIILYQRFTSWTISYNAAVNRTVVVELVLSYRWRGW